MSRKLGSTKGAASKKGGSNSTTANMAKGKGKSVGGCAGYKHAGASSSFLGVHFERKSNRFKANVTIKGKSVHAGTFTNEVEAAVRRDAKVRELGLGHPYNFASEKEATEALQAIGVDVRPYKPRTASSAFIGVHWNTNERRWRASVKFQGKSVDVGYFNNEMEAAVHRDNKVRELGWPLQFNFSTKVEANAVLQAAPADKGMEPRPKCGTKFLGANASSFKGVYWHSTSQRWTSHILHCAKRVHVGTFTNEVEAAVRRDEKVCELGSELELNFSTKEAATAALQAALGDDSVESRPKGRIKSRESSATNRGSVVGADPAERKRSDFRGGEYALLLTFELIIRLTLVESIDLSPGSFVVHWDKREECWKGTVSKGGKRIHVGKFDNEVEAAMRRDDKVRERGWDLPLNFLSEEETTSEAPKKRATAKTSSFRGGECALPSFEFIVSCCFLLSD